MKNLNDKLFIAITLFGVFFLGIVMGPDFHNLIQSENVEWERYQFLISAIGIIFVLITLLYTARSTRAAAESSQAAVKSLQLAGRGYVGIKSFKFNRADMFDEDKNIIKGIVIIPELICSGNAPVLIKSTIISMRVINKGEDKQLIWDDDLKPPESNILILPNSHSVTTNEIVLNKPSLIKIFKGELRVLYMYKIKYKDIEGNDYHNHACFEVKVYLDPEIIINNTDLKISDYIVMEASGEYGSAS